jgi:hypothetical protein
MSNVERRTIMKTTKNTMVNGVKCRVYGVVVMLLVLSGTVQATAPAYRNTYKGTKDNVQGTMYSVQSTAPAVGFQSTSAYSGQWGNGSITPMLNADGSMNGSAYMGAPSRPRKVDDDNDGYDDETGMPVNPNIGGGDDGNTPLGDGLLPLMLLACAFAIYKVTRVRVRNSGGIVIVR